jgi:transcriptional regulator with XRE-family HTH domain
MNAESRAPTYGRALGQLILKKRRAKGLTQTQLSEDAFGTAAKTRRIHELESGTVANPHPTTIDPIIAVLKISEAELEACSEVSGQLPDLELDRAYREARNLIEAAARQFEHANPDASLAELEDYLRSKAREWRQLRQRIQTMEAADRERETLRDSATAALAAGEFERVDALLAEAEETQQKERTLQEVERQAQIRITRGDAALFREDAAAALELYRTAARFFDPFEPERTAELLSNLAGRVYEISLRSLTPKFDIARKLLDELATHSTVRHNRVELGVANYRRGLLYRNEAVGRVGTGVDEELLRQALEFDRLAVDSIEGDDVADLAVSSRISLGICLIEMDRFEPKAGHLDSAIEVLSGARSMAEEAAPPLVGNACNNLGAAYIAKFRRQKGPNRVNALESALREFGRAITEAEKYAASDIWGAANINSARVLIELVELSGSESKRRGFDRIRALAHYNAGIETYPETLFPDRFAEANAELAEVLGALALEAPAPFSEAYFARALNTYGAATGLFSKEIHPRRWADIHMRVGALFGNRAMLLDEPTDRRAHLEQARTCFHAAADVFSSTGDADQAKACRDAVERVTGQLDNDPG